MNRFIKSFYYATKGILSALLSERNMKVHLLAVVVVSAAGFYFHITRTEWLAVILCFALVISLEMLNTAIEILADKINPEKDEAIGKAKDIAAGAVMVAAIFSVAVAVIIFGKYIL
jgi:diacylglycerol kinase (ATP)